eukprot:1186542-Rhodomonas_salina.1
MKLWVKFRTSILRTLSWIAKRGNVGCRAARLPALSQRVASSIIGLATGDDETYLSISSVRVAVWHIPVLG